MPRKDRTYSRKDIIRIYCNYLTPDEMAGVKEFFSDGAKCKDFPDEDGLCIVLSDILDEWADVFSFSLNRLTEIIKIIKALKNTLKHYLPQNIYHFFKVRINGLLVYLEEYHAALKKFDTKVRSSLNYLKHMRCDN